MDFPNLTRMTRLHWGFYDPIEQLKKNLRFRGIYIGDEILPSYVGMIVNHEIRILIKQPGFNGK